MNREEEIKRRIELKRQFIILTEREIKALEGFLTKAATEDHRKSGNPIHLPPIHN